MEHHGVQVETRGRKTLPPYNKPSINEFFSYNRFLFEALVLEDKPTLASVSQALQTSQNRLRERLFDNRFPTSMKSLRRRGV